MEELLSGINALRTSLLELREETTQTNLDMQLLCVKVNAQMEKVSSSNCVSSTEVDSQSMQDHTEYVTPSNVPELTPFSHAT